MLFIPTIRTRAHSLDMYAQAQTIQISSDGLQVDWKITPGPLLAESAWGQSNQSQNGSISQPEAQAWLTPFFSQYIISLDGQTVKDVKIREIHWPASPDLLQSGEDPIEIRMVVKWPERLNGSHQIMIHNANQEAISLNAYALTAGTGITFSSPAQSNGRLDVNINFSAAVGSGTSGLTSWESGQPELSGVTSILTGMAGNLVKPGNTQPATNSLTGVSAALAGLVRTQNFSPLFLAGAFLLSLALGSLHALTPGHGKTLVAAYLVGSHGRKRDAIFLGSIVTLTHTGSVLIFGLITLLASRFIFPTLIAPWLEIISGLAVAGFGLSLFISRGRAFSTWYQAERAKKLAGHFRAMRLAVSGHVDEPSRYVINVAPQQPVAPFRPHLHSEDHEHGEPGHTHSHPHSDEHEHGYSHPHSHTLPSDQINWKSLLTLGISGGLVPCPDAIAILVVAVAIGRIPLGMLLIVAFSIGLALVLIGIGIAMVQGTRLIQRNEWLNHFSRYTPVLSAVVVLGLGIGLSVSAVNSLRLSTAALQGSASLPSGLKTSGPAFDIRKAKLIYLSQDSQYEYQLSTIALSGGTPAGLTHEPGGVDGYALSPDGKTILFTVIEINGDSSLKAINTDGSNPHLVLNCPQTQCEQPVWYPNSQKVVYERLDTADSTVSPMFTIWWLDLATSKTSPVFPDQNFPGLSPAFSPDGQWLSYVSPATNTLDVDNLFKNQTIRIPQSNQSFAQELWSPAADSVLYWYPTNSQPDAAIHVMRYILASGTKIDLGGAPQQADYADAWSPDGQWIAIVRDDTNTTSTSIGEEIWLVRPDGSQGHVLLDGLDSFSDLSWSPDSTYLAFDQTPIQGNSKSEAWLADIRTGKLTEILDGVITPTLLP
ncbi:MAG TPA: sulfite exporter TauE/SafE family protein [Anaerolineales bacterium]|nr:sulfite exporter TauE/SafE family protein [Anaerolineales bacterium]